MQDADGLARDGTAAGNSFQCVSSAFPSEINSHGVEGLITYKRRKHSRPCTKWSSQENGPFSSSDDRIRNQIAKQQCDKAFHIDTNEEDGLSPNTLERPVPPKSANDFPRAHWKNVLEDIFQSMDLSGNGIQSCIQDALASNKFKMHATTHPKQAAEGEGAILHHKDKRRGHSQHPRESKYSFSSEHDGKTSVESPKVQDDEANDPTITRCCQNVFLDIIISENFVLFCNLLCQNFEGIKADTIFNFSLINSRMRNGQYEHSLELFASDIQEVWKKFEKIGEEMIHLARTLSNIAQNSFQKHLGGMLHGNVVDRRNEHRLGIEQNNLMDLDTPSQLPSCRLDRSSKLEQTEACGFYIVCTCRECGAEADVRQRLICDRCEAAYHITCIKPAIEGIPISWYCFTCLTDKELPEPESTKIHGETPHQNCVVCKRCNDTDNQIIINCIEMTRVFNNLEAKVDFSVKTKNLRKSQRSRPSRLCMLCKMGEDDGKKMLVCGNTHCPNKYYHLRCLRFKQLNCPYSQWYCPSCLCRACLFDKDDDKIVLCDGCDEAYHTYCLVPPRTTIPKGSWYCKFCSIGIRARRKTRMRNESFVKKQNNVSRGGYAFKRIRD